MGNEETDADDISVPEERTITINRKLWEITEWFAEKEKDKIEKFKLCGGILLIKNEKTNAIKLRNGNGDDLWLPRSALKKFE